MTKILTANLCEERLLIVNGAEGTSVKLMDFEVETFKWGQLLYSAVNV